MQNHKPNLNFYIDTEDDYYLQLFEGMFPRDVLDTMVDGVNKQTTRDPLTYGEIAVLDWPLGDDVNCGRKYRHVILTFFGLFFSLCQIV